MFCALSNPTFWWPQTSKNALDVGEDCSKPLMHLELPPMLDGRKRRRRRRRRRWLERRRAHMECSCLNRVSEFKSGLKMSEGRDSRHSIQLDEIPFAFVWHAKLRKASDVERIEFTESLVQDPWVLFSEAMQDHDSSSLQGMTSFQRNGAHHKQSSANWWCQSLGTFWCILN